MVYVMATLDRGRMIDAGRGKELEDLICCGPQDDGRDHGRRPGVNAWGVLNEAPKGVPILLPRPKTTG